MGPGGTKKRRLSLPDITPESMDDLRSFVRSHTGWMLGVAIRILLDRQYAEDAVQTSFTKIITKSDDFNGTGSFRGWMHRIVINEALMLRRKVQRRNEVHIDALLPEFDKGGCRIDPQLAETVTPEMMLQDAQLVQAVTMAIQTLPEQYRIIICLRDIEGLSIKETASLLEITEENVKVRLHRARSALKKLLQDLKSAGQL